MQERGCASLYNSARVGAGGDRMSYSLAIGLSWLRIGCCAHRQDFRWHACCCCVVLCVVRICLSVMYSNADRVAYSRLCSVMSMEGRPCG
jgi:hypothetical protein